MAGQFWKWRFEETGDREYVLYDRDITMSALRHAKQWFGREYGTYTGFCQLLMTGDADAVAHATWILNRKNGWGGPEPRQMDYALADFIQADQSDDTPVEDDVEDAVVDPTGPAAEGTTTRGSGKTPKRSAHATSST